MNQANVTHLNRDVRFPPSGTHGSPSRELSGAGPRPYTPRPENRDGTAAPRKFVAKGHDAQLQDAQYGKLSVTLTTMSGSVFTGQVVKRDKYTITLRHAVGAFENQEEIFYKHAIEGVLITRPELAN